MDLIDRKELLKRFDLTTQANGNAIRYEIKCAPAVDVEPVRYGKWIVTAGGKVCKCSVCGDEFDNTCNYDIRKDWKCCPVCKCLMDGDE